MTITPPGAAVMRGRPIQNGERNDAACHGNANKLSKMNGARSRLRAGREEVWYIRLTMDSLDELIRRSHDTPILLFKHSQTCGTSAMAYDELDTFRQSAPAVTVVVVDVFQDRALAREIASRASRPLSATTCRA